MSYQIEFLDHDSFDALPYPDMEQALGVADPKTQRAFVRKTGIKAVDLFNAAHELEHLQEGHEGAHADHYRNGVFYKDFGQMMGPIGTVVGSMFGGPVGGALGGGLGQLGSGAMGGGSKPQAQQPVMSQFQAASQGSAPSGPNVIQPQSNAGGSGGGQSGPGGIGDIQKQLYGNYSGR